MGISTVTGSRIPRDVWRGAGRNRQIDELAHSTIIIIIIISCFHVFLNHWYIRLNCRKQLTERLQTTVVSQTPVSVYRATRRSITLVAVRTWNLSRPIVMCWTGSKSSRLDSFYMGFIAIHNDRCHILPCTVTQSWVQMYIHPVNSLLCGTGGRKKWKESDDENMLYCSLRASTWCSVRPVYAARHWSGQGSVADSCEHANQPLGVYISMYKTLGTN
jgi:hypothetical protein